MSNPRPEIALIAAVSKNGVIGKNGGLPWKISSDLKRFRQLTAGHPVIMGRKTYESIGKPLPERTNIVITRDSHYPAPGCIVVSSIEKAVEEAKKIESEIIFVIGGGEIYRTALPFADVLYLTLVHAEMNGDAFFPDYSEFKKVLASEEGEEGVWRYSFLKLTR